MRLLQRNGCKGRDTRGVSGGSSSVGMVELPLGQKVEKITRRRSKSPKILVLDFLCIYLVEKGKKLYG